MTRMCSQGGTGVCGGSAEQRRHLLGKASLFGMRSKNTPCWKSAAFLPHLAWGKASDALPRKEDSRPGGSLREIASTFYQQPAAKASHQDPLDALCGDAVRRKASRRGSISTSVNKGRFTQIEGNAYCVGDSAPTARTGLILMLTIPIGVFDLI